MRRVRFSCSDVADVQRDAGKERGGEVEDGAGDGRDWVSRALLCRVLLVEGGLGCGDVLGLRGWGLRGWAEGVRDNRSSADSTAPVTGHFPNGDPFGCTRAPARPESLLTWRSQR